MATVLLVDDSAVDRRLVEHLLRSAGKLLVHAVHNGKLALQEMRRQLPDVVVTDIVMPELDGLQLVESIRAEFPQVPVVLMTSLGTEGTAVKALQAGAASFVPKSRLSDRLLDTIRQVLTLTRVEHPYRGLLRNLEKTDNTFRLASQLTPIPPLVDLVQMTLASMGVCDATDAIRLSLALEEALLNSLVHGNLELTEHLGGRGFQRDTELFRERCQQPPYCQRQTEVRIDITTFRAKFVVRDEGSGFDIAGVPAVDDLSLFEHGFGRGLRLMRSFMHEVLYNDTGNTVTMIRHF